MKAILKVIFIALAALAAIIGIAYFEKETTPDYIEVYSDDDDDDYSF